uniref:Uncharacterized protein n=1 Tax=Arcella intermedia TaxID=1963864 RepID=A0A6B2LJA9_9EUKA
MKICHQELLTHSDCTVTFLVCNKIDLKDGYAEVNSEKAIAYAKEHKMKFFETSAKENTGVEEVFTELAEDIISYKKSNPNPIKKDGNPTTPITGAPLTSQNEKQDCQC